jgi:NADPH-dependent 2,4-dienoyl-CoA reductase/sulfur reductase-like enzyme/Fe-S-cluster-containing hydrogenase component 2/bacterioferritin-associated ferredoxin
MPTDNRLHSHPILTLPKTKQVGFYWKNELYKGIEGEPISAALYANNIRIFGHHIKDHAPQGLFCANGQCAQCMVLMDGKPVKSCVQPLHENVYLEPIDELPKLPIVSQVPIFSPSIEKKVQVLIIGGGPSGLSAALELARTGISSLLVDDKSELGGKLVLQTHRFFGSSQTVYAGTRGIDIAQILSQEISKQPLIEVWKNSTALAVYKDKKVGILRNEKEYALIEPEYLLIACGARERFISFPGNTLPGIMGAGAFQTLLNRDKVKPADKVFIIGGGNVGLIAGYHAIQAGIEVVGLAEALPECSGYRVHKDKLARLGVPIFTSHTIIQATGNTTVEKVTIAELGKDGKPIYSSEKSFDVDGVLIAVGLESIDELYQKAREYDIPADIAGDAEEIAEASAAIYSGKIKAYSIAAKMGKIQPQDTETWNTTLNILKAKPGIVQNEKDIEFSSGVMPVIHCRQEIPCDPCTQLCPKGYFKIDQNDIRSIPIYTGDSQHCIGCEKCVAGCPGLAITLVDYRKDAEKPLVSIAAELDREILDHLSTVTITDVDGNSLGSAPVRNIHTVPRLDHTLIIEVQVEKEIATKVAGIHIQSPKEFELQTMPTHATTDDAIICRCERVTAGEIRSLIRGGVRDMNELKTITRAGAGSCGSKTCRSLILRIFREEGVPLSEVTPGTHRPLFKEVELGIFAGIQPEEKQDSHDNNA